MLADGDLGEEMAFKGRREDGRMLTGAGRYTADWNRPGQAHAAFLRADRAHAAISAIDTGAARASPGVLAVLTGADMVAAGFDKGSAMMPVTGRGEALRVPPRSALATARVRFVGEPVALVVAETPHQAWDATERIAVAYDPLPAVIDAHAALATGAPVIHDSVPGNLCLDFDYGDEAATDAAFAAATHVARLTLTSPRVAGNPMEPRAALAAWDGETLDLWTPTQGMTAFRESFVAQSGMAPERVRIRAQDVGGGFGIRGPAYPEHLALARAARVVGRPVKWVASRSETFLSDYHGRGLEMLGALALDADGRFLALRHEWIADQGAHPVATGPLINSLNPASMSTGCYRIPIVYGRHRLVLTNTVPVTAYRGAGRPDMAYIIERLVDAAAYQAGIDRIEIRRRNLLPRDAFPYRVPAGPAGGVYDSGDYRAALDQALATADWAGLPARRADAATRGRLRGIGCAVFVEPSGGVVPKDEVAITFEPDGTVVLHTVVTSNGQGHETLYPEIVARVFGIDPERVRFSAGDPEGPALVGGGAFASRSMMSHGAAGLVCAREVLEKGKALAAEALEAAVADIEFADGMFRVAGTDRVVSLTTLAGGGALDTTTGLAANRAFPSGAHVAEVEIDPETGETTLMRYVAIDDCGVVMNHTLLEGQILGGLFQGLGQVFGERCVYDPDGQLLSGSFMDYAMPRADVLTDFSIGDCCVPSPNNPLGVKGAGEAGTTGALPAAMNAVLDALRPAGVTHLDMPATAERVWLAVREA
jgi:carbon-monoxide dehydrogenase large subunit